MLDHDCISHDLLIAILFAYGFGENNLTFFYSYLKRHKQNVKINNTYNFFKELLSRLPQGSLLGPILFNSFINDLFLWLSPADLRNFAGDNVSSAFSKDLQELIEKLEDASECAMKWFTNDLANISTSGTDVENEAKSDVGFSELYNVDTTSVPEVETTLHNV